MFAGGAASSRAQACNEAGIIFSTFGVGALAVFDIAAAPGSVRRYNESRVAFAPYMNPRDRAYGVSMSLSFGRSRALGPRPVARSRVTQDSIRSHKSPGTGFALSFFSTVVPMAAGVGLGGNAGGATVFIAGVVVGPSVGHFYAAQGWRGVGTAALRAAGTGAFIASIAGCFDD